RFCRGPPRARRSNDSRGELTVLGTRRIAPRRPQTWRPHRVHLDGRVRISDVENYNKVGRPAAVAVTNGEARLILRRETADDLARLDVD
ncbi:MAG TPA: hypothetical protein VHI54_08725, partial [Actinomycetota bacterium]|nr:hypothetical protein [Actinomycetota bacterium]